MSLTAADIAEIARLLDESHFTDLKLETGGIRLRIRRERGGWAPPYEDEEEEVAEAPSPRANRCRWARKPAPRARARSMSPRRCSAISTKLRVPAIRRLSSPATR